MKTTLIAALMLGSATSAFACGYGSTYDRLECTLRSGSKTDTVTLDLDRGGDIAGLDIPGVARANLQALGQRGSNINLKFVVQDFSRGLPVQGETDFHVPQECDVRENVVSFSRNMRDAANRTVNVSLNCDAVRFFDAD